MARYFFDTDDGHGIHRDVEGLDVTDVLAARKAAMEALPDMLRDKLPDGDRRTFSVTVRNQDSTVLYTAVLSFVGQWHIMPLPA